MNNIAYTGLWLQPISMAILYNLLESKQGETTLVTLALMLLVSFLPSFYVWSINSGAKANGKKQFGLLDAFNRINDPYYLSSRKRQALYPTVAKYLLSKKTDGFILGKKGSQYLRIPFEDDFHIFLLGGSGSGKSKSVLIPSFLAISMLPEDERPTVIAVDVKGELSNISTRLGDPGVIIFDPEDRRSYGFDPFHLLEESYSDQDLLEVAQIVVDALIPSPSDGKDQFWILSARQMFEGFILHFYKEGFKTLPDIIDQITGMPVGENVEQAISNSSLSTAEYRDLITFHEMPAETITGVYAQMAPSLLSFSNDNNIRFSFKENPKKFTLSMIDEGKMIFIRIKDEKLGDYAYVLKILINIINRFLQKREESEKNRKVIFVIDEVSRIVSSGAIKSLVSSLQILRSKKTSLILAGQSLEGLLDAYSDAQVTDMYTNCSYKLLLTDSQKAGKFFCENAGKYMEIKKSKSRNKGKYQDSISFEEKDILTMKDLQVLIQKREVAMLTPFGYQRCKSAYFLTDKILGPIAKENIFFNESISKK